MQYDCSLCGPVAGAEHCVSDTESKYHQPVTASYNAALRADKCALGAAHHDERLLLDGVHAEQEEMS